MDAEAGEDLGPVLEGKVIDFPQDGHRSSYEVSLDEDLDEEDLPTGPAEPGGKPIKLPAARRQRKPLIPAHLDTWDKVSKRLADGANDAGYFTLFHGIRSLWYLFKYTRWMLRGARLFFTQQIGWWWLVEARPALWRAAAEQEGREYRNHHNHIRGVRGERGVALAFEAGALLVTAILLAAYAPVLIQVLTAACTWIGLAQLGKPKGQALFTPTMIKPRIRTISGDVVIRAYMRAGLCDPDKPGMELSFPAPMSRDRDDKGSRVPIALPYGYTFEMARKALDKIASGLDVKRSQVSLIEDDDSERTHVLYVADRDPLAEAAGRTPLLDLKQRNIWHEMELGLDQFGRKVMLSLLWISILIGSQPRKGKTFTARHLALYAALDPYVKIVIIDGKASPDWKDFRLVAHRFVQGTRPTRDGDPVKRAIAVLDEVIDHIHDVNEFLNTLPTSECPKGKITEELSRKYDICRVWMVFLEEYQEYVELDDPKVCLEIARRLSTIRAIGPSAGVIVVSSTQKPVQVGTGQAAPIMTRFRDNHDVRIGLRCSRNVSDAVLSGEAASEGYDCSKLPLGKRYRGIYILHNVFDQSPTVRGYLADGEDAEVICQAGRRYRERLGLITGDAGDDEEGVPTRDVLADVLAVFGSDERLQWVELADRLAGRFPDRWADVSPESVSADVRALGVERSQAKREGVNRQGCKRADVEAAQQRFVVPA